MTQFDVIVVGAGPAGSTAARELAASGARVLIVDRASFPRYKACGGGIPVRTARMLPFPINSVVEDAVHELDISLRGRHGFVKDSGTPFAHMVMRDRFDALLLQQAQIAGAEFRPGTAVRGLETGTTVRIDGGGFEAEAPFLICADGAHSPVGRMAGLGDGIAECAAWEVEVETGASHGYRSHALIDLGYRPWGYAWVFPKAQHLSIGIVMPRERGKDMRRLVNAYLHRLGLEDAGASIQRGHKIRFRRGDEPIARGNVLLAGDAAGLADEFTEEGISYAIHSGRLAARNTLRAMAGDGDLAPYQADVNAEIMPELKAARVLGLMLYGAVRRIPRPWMFASAHTSFIWDAFFTVQRGDSTYHRELARVPLVPALTRWRNGL